MTTNTKEDQFKNKVKHLCIDGVIGAGKTTLCNILAERFNARLVLEQAEENPFLDKFYRNRRSFAFQTQLWFLLSRHRQLTEITAQSDLFYDLTIADYMLDKDRIFASINLDEHEMTLYTSIVDVLRQNIPLPDYVVYLQASTDTLMKRIEKRGRSYEFNMDYEYIDMLNKAYNHYYFHYTQSPLLIIDTDTMNVVANTVDREDVINQIISYKPGSTYYHPPAAQDRLKLSQTESEK